MMSESKFQRIFDTQTSVAKKVYNVVPKQDVWAVQQINAELNRLQQSIDFHILGGVLDSLVRAGLIQEVGKGRFMREPIRKKAVPAEKPQPQEVKMPPAPSQAVAQKTALDKLIELSKAIETLGKAAAMYAKQLEDIALEVEEQIEKGSAEMKNLRQLRALLKTVTDADS